MSEVDKNQKPNNSSDEIDLRELFSAIGNFFKNIFVGILMLIVNVKNTTIRNIKLIVILGFLGGIAGIAIHFSGTEYYQSSMLFRSSHLNRSLMENSIDKLSQLCEEESYDRLAEILKIDRSVAEQIKDFAFEPEEEILELELLRAQISSVTEDQETIDRFMARFEDVDRNRYQINVQVYDYEILDQLTEPLLAYFKNNPYVKKRLEIEKQTLELQEQNINEELQKLDSLKNILFKNFNTMTERTRTGSNNVILGEEQYTNPITVFSESRKQYQEKLSIQKQLFLEPQFELIDGFVQYREPASLGLFKLGFYGGLSGLGIAYIIILLGAINSYLNSIEEKYKAENEKSI